MLEPEVVQAFTQAKHWGFICEIGIFRIASGKVFVQDAELSVAAYVKPASLFEALSVELFALSGIFNEDADAATNYDQLLFLKTENTKGWRRLANLLGREVSIWQFNPANPGIPDLLHIFNPLDD